MQIANSTSPWSKIAITGTRMMQTLRLTGDRLCSFGLPISGREIHNSVRLLSSACVNGGGLQKPSWRTWEKLKLETSGAPATYLVGCLGKYEQCLTLKSLRVKKAFVDTRHARMDFKDQRKSHEN